jgi:hypothetical protein
MSGDAYSGQEIIGDTQNCFLTFPPILHQSLAKAFRDQRKKPA